MPRLYSPVRKSTALCVTVPRVTAGRTRAAAWCGLAALAFAAACSSVDADVTAARSDQIPTTTAGPDLVPSDPTTETVSETEGTEPPVDQAVTTTTTATSTPTAETIVDDDAAGDGTQADGAASSGDDDAPDQADIDALLADLEAAGFCDPDDVRDDGIVTAMHFVVGGALQRPCYVDQPGDDVAEVVVDEDPRLIAAWDSLVAVTPNELVADISLLAGYEPCATCDTLAFVTVLDEGSTFFLLAVDVVSGEQDPDELRLTMMHELTHVFAQKKDEQLDVSVTDAAGCDTFFNGAGCFTQDSYMWAWIQAFWPPEVLATLPADGSVDSDEDAAERCARDPAYTGSYAAVHPEEDFAETFSAYVYDVEVDPALAEKFAFFDRYPEFVSIRDNARALGLAGTEANFDGCG